MAPYLHSADVMKESPLMEKSRHHKDGVKAPHVGGGERNHIIVLHMLHNLYKEITLKP